MTTALVRWQDTPRVYVVEASDPKRKGLRARTGWLDIGQQQSVAVMDAARKDYGRRVGHSLVGMFPSSVPTSLKPKSRKLAKVA